MSSRITDYTRFFTKISKRRDISLIRHMTAEYIKNGSKGIFLASGMPNSEMFPFKEISITYKDNTVKKLVDEKLSTALQYGPSKGYPPLINKFRGLQEKWHSPKYKDWDVQMTAGSQDGCNMVIELLVEEGQPIMIQSPMYAGCLSVIKPMNLDCICLEMDDDGILPDHITEVFAQRTKAGKMLPKLLYINPTGANPTGCVYGDERKLEIYKLACKYDFLILEDDAYYFLHFLNKIPTSFLSLDTDGRVIRADSFSKILTSGVRVGVITGPKQIIDILTIRESASILHVPSLSQVVISELLESWSYEKLMQHFAEVRTFYLERRNAILEALEKHFTGIAQWSAPKGGMFVWVKINIIDDVYDLAMNKCMPQGCYVLPGHVFSVDGNDYKQYFRICYSQASKEEMNEGLAKIAKIIKDGASPLVR